jgi:dipeptidyl aminopeptidase/acylaminoacyl peptidase
MLPRSLVVLALAITVLAGCTVPRPPGDGQLRYRDQVFSGVTVTKDLTYGSAPDLDGNPVTLKLDLYQPTGDTVTQRPAVVWIHGGGFTMGDKGSGVARASHLVKLGYVVVSINYRLLAPPGCAGDLDPDPICVTAALAAQHDAQAAVRWLRAHAATYKLDTNRIAAAGASAGAITSLLVDWRSEDPGDSGNPGPSSKIRAAVSVSGGTPTNEYITQDDGPALFIHGTEDHVVAYQWAVQNAAAMYNLGILTVLEPIEGAAHGLAADYAALIDEQTGYFLYWAMDMAHAAH